MSSFFGDWYPDPVIFIGGPRHGEFHQIQGQEYQLEMTQKPPRFSIFRELTTTPIETARYLRGRVLLNDSTGWPVGQRDMFYYAGIDENQAFSQFFHTCYGPGF